MSSSPAGRSTAPDPRGAPESREAAGGTASRPSIGLIGLGIMGRPMGRNLLRAGHRLVVHDVDRLAVDELVAEGAAAGRTPDHVARETDV